MQILWLFFILSNLFYVFYFDENVFYFILFSILFLPNFFNSKFYSGQVSIFQYIQYMRTNLSNLILFVESTKKALKEQLAVLLNKLHNKSKFYNNVGFISLFQFLLKDLIVILEKDNLIQNLELIDSLFLNFFKNASNYLSVSEKKQLISVLNLNTNKTNSRTGQDILNMLNSKYRSIENVELVSSKTLIEVSALLAAKNENKK